MANKWLQHLSKFRRQNTGMDAKDVMREARKTYQSGGGDSEVVPYQPTNLASTASTLKGGRRRKSRRQTRKSRRTRRR